MIRMISTLKNSIHTRALRWALAVAAVTCFAPVIASAQVHDYRGRHDRGQRYDKDRHDHGKFRFDFGFRSPGYDRRVERVWVEPIYQTQIDRVWVEPVYRTEIERIWIEPVYEMREVVRFEWGRRVVYHERVLVRPGCWEERPRRVLVCEGHWQNIERQVLVRAGYWEECVVTLPSPDPVFGFGFGYRK